MFRILRSRLVARLGPYRDGVSDLSEHHSRIWDPMSYPRVALTRSLGNAVDSLRLPPRARVLDFGCGAKPYRELFAADIDYIGADLLENDQADIAIQGGVVDLPDQSVDLVLSTQVLEHVPDPHAYLTECHRVLRPGGRLVLTTHGVMFYHPHPGDFWRWTIQGLSTIIGHARLEISSISPLLGAVPTGLWLMMINVQAGLPRGLRHAFVTLVNLLMRWSNRVDWATYRADFNYIVVAQRPDRDASVPSQVNER
jgi:SAM-dependent methyltransferase